MYFTTNKKKPLQKESMFNDEKNKKILLIQQLHLLTVVFSKLCYQE